MSLARADPASLHNPPGSVSALLAGRVRHEPVTDVVRVPVDLSLDAAQPMPDAPGVDGGTSTPGADLKQEFVEVRFEERWLAVALIPRGGPLNQLLCREGLLAKQAPEMSDQLTGRPAFRVFRSGQHHAVRDIRPAEPNQRFPREPGPTRVRVGCERGARHPFPPDDVGTGDGENGRDVASAIGSDASVGIIRELAPLRVLVLRIEVA